LPSLAADPNPGNSVTISKPNPIAAVPASPQSNPSLFTSAENCAAVPPTPATAAATFPYPGIAVRPKDPRSSKIDVNCILSADVKEFQDIPPLLFPATSFIFLESFTIVVLSILSLTVVPIKPPFCLFSIGLYKGTKYSLSLSLVLFEFLDPRTSSASTNFFASSSLNPRSKAMFFLLSSPQRVAH
jgi:hypothetical protein